MLVLSMLLEGYNWTCSGPERGQITLDLPILSILVFVRLKNVRFDGTESDRRCFITKSGVRLEGGDRLLLLLRRGNRN